MEAKRKRTKNIIIAAVLVAVAILMATLPAMLSSGQKEENTGTAKSVAVQRGDIDSTVAGAGTLSGGDGVKITVPHGVEITEYLVANGDVPHFVGDLHGKLAGGCQDHRLHLLALPVNALDNGDAERHGLAGAGRCLGDDVLPRQHGRDAPRLYGGADGVMLIAYGAHGGV